MSPEKQIEPLPQEVVDRFEQKAHPVNCGNCKFLFSQEEKDNFMPTTTIRHYCRRYPPGFLTEWDVNGDGYSVTTWPQVELADWCGEHQSKIG